MIVHAHRSRCQTPRNGRAFPHEARQGVPRGVATPTLSPYLNSRVSLEYWHADVGSVREDYDGGNESDATCILA